jgi:cytochrome c-type biogenesis protein
MLESLFTLLEAFLLKSTSLMFLASFVWGLLSIMLSPCHLSGIPIAILSSQKTSHRPEVVPGLFAIGIVLSLLGMAVLTFGLGQSLLQYSISSSWVLAFVLLLSGLVMLDLIPLNFSIPQPKLKSGFILQPISMGLFFGLLVGPCTLAFAMPIIVASGIASGSSSATGLFLFSTFATGHVLATIIFGTSLQRTSDWLGKKKSITILKLATGVLLIISGLYYLYSAISK